MSAPQEPQEPQQEVGAKPYRVDTKSLITGGTSRSITLGVEEVQVLSITIRIIDFDSPFERVVESGHLTHYTTEFIVRTEVLVVPHRLSFVETGGVAGVSCLRPAASHARSMTTLASLR